MYLRIRGASTGSIWQSWQVGCSFSWEIQMRN